MKESKDKILISVPAREEMAEIVRMATTAIANRAGLDIDQSDDVNTAMEEVFRFLCTSCAVEGDDVSMDFSFDRESLRIKAGDSRSSLADSETKIGRYCCFILEKVTDGYSEISDQGRFSIVIEKTLKS